MKSLSMGRRAELLSPAGSFEAALAAFQYGADAVYLGLNAFSARAEAVNFSPEELARICAYAHSLTPRRSVYAAVNTLIRDDEIDGAITTLDAASSASVDGVIVQDFAVFSLIRRFFPNLQAHASTQMAVHNLEGAIALREAGFSRVVLARELSFDEIRRIAAESGVEIEVFVHGALCYGYSGLCLFSAMRTGRSGNRGRCAYCCRGEFHDESGGRGFYPFSMRDLFLLDCVRELRDAGVASLKIEGRMKSPLYVASVTDLYRRELDGKLDDPDERAAAISDVQTVFSRPATTLHFNGDSSSSSIIDPDAVGHRGAFAGRVRSVWRSPRGERRLCFATQRPLEVHDGLQVEFKGQEPGRPYGFAIDRMRLAGERAERFEAPSGARVEVLLPKDAPDIPAGAEVFCSSSQAVRRRYAVRTPRAGELEAARPAACKVSIRQDALECEAVADGIAVRESMSVSLDHARNSEATPEAVRKAFSRLGGTGWALDSLEVDDPESLYVPASVLNEARRSLFARLDSERAARHEAAIAEIRKDVRGILAVPIAPVPLARRSAKVRVDSPVTAHGDFDETVVALTCESCRDVQRLVARVREWGDAAQSLRISLPVIMRRGDARLCREAIAALVAESFVRWECCDVSGLDMLRRVQEPALEITADGSLYSFNGLSARFLRGMGVAAAVAPFESDDAQILESAPHSAPWLIVPIRFRPPLFISETRPAAPPPGAAHLELEDRQGWRCTVDRCDGKWLTRAASPVVRDEARFAAAGFTMFRHDLTDI